MNLRPYILRYEKYLSVTGGLLMFRTFEKLCFVVVQTLENQYVAQFRGAYQEGP